jgi:integrase
MTHAQAPSTEEQMLGRQAKIVSPATLRRMLAYARQARRPKRDTVIVLLSVKAGLRACEIAGLQWSMVMTDNGKIADVIDIRDTIAKRGAGRRIPMHPDLQRALAELWRVRTSDRYIVASNRGGPMRANSIVNSPNSASTVARLTQAAGPSSLSPPRTCIAPAAACATFSCSLATNRSTPPSATSTATRQANAGL